MFSFKVKILNSKRSSLNRKASAFSFEGRGEVSASSRRWFWSFHFADFFYHLPSSPSPPALPPTIAVFPRSSVALAPAIDADSCERAEVCELKL